MFDNLLEIIVIAIVFIVYLIVIIIAVVIENSVLYFNFEQLFYDECDPSTAQYRYLFKLTVGPFEKNVKRKELRNAQLSITLLSENNRFLGSVLVKAQKLLDKYSRNSDNTTNEMRVMLYRRTPIEETVVALKIDLTGNPEKEVFIEKIEFFDLEEEFCNTYLINTSIRGLNPLDAPKMQVFRITNSFPVDSTAMSVTGISFSLLFEVIVIFYLCTGLSFGFSGLLIMALRDNWRNLFLLALLASLLTVVSIFVIIVLFKLFINQFKGTRHKGWAKLGSYILLTIFSLSFGLLTAIFRKNTPDQTWDCAIASFISVIISWTVVSIIYAYISNVYKTFTVFIKK